MMPGNHGADSGLGPIWGNVEQAARLLFSGETPELPAYFRAFQRKPEPTVVGTRYQNAWSAACLALLLIACGACTAFSQEYDAALRMLEARYAIDEKGGSSSPAQRLHLVLGDLERRRAEQGNYDGAARVRGHIDALELKVPSLKRGTKGARIALAAAKAKTTGSVRFVRSDGTLVGWNRPGNGATWDIGSIVPGIYEVYVTCSVTDKVVDATDGRPKQSAGGSFIVRQESGLTGQGSERLTQSVSKTGGWDHFETIFCGRMKFENTSATLIVETATANPLGVMHLKEIEFREAVEPKANGGGDLLKRFQTLKAAQLRELDKLLTPIEKRYVQQLETGVVDKEKDAKVEANRVRKLATSRREKMATSPANPGAEEGASRFVLSATDKLSTFLSGQALVHSSGDFVTSLRPTGSYVQWNLNRLNIPPGSYEAVIEFRTAERMGGQFKLQCGSESLNGKINAGLFGSFNRDFRSQRLSPLRITKAARTLRFEVATLRHNDGALCDLRSITLIPETTSSGHEKKHPDGYVQWSGVTFSTAFPNAGESFGIRYKGKDYHVRLYGINCPPGATRDARNEAHENMRNHFGVTAQNLSRGGRQAIQLTEETLRRKPFSVFTKKKKNQNDEILVYVLIDQDTLLSEKLTENGLTTASGQRAPLPDAIKPGVSGEQYHAWLRRRETEAREAKEGVWKYRRE